MMIVVSIKDQKLIFFKDGVSQKEYPISTSRFGIGNKAGSRKTPLGLHKICEKIGKDLPLGSIFKGRKDTGEIITDSSFYNNQNLITTRILRLKGLEEGINKGKGIDSEKRYIWIHGTSQENMIGKPASQGCVRMKNKDIAELFNLVRVGSEVRIEE